METAGIIIAIAALAWLAFDYVKHLLEARRCPKCGHLIKMKGAWKYKKNPVNIPGDEGSPYKVTIYKCPKCGTGWNKSREYPESS